MLRGAQVEIEWRVQRERGLYRKALLVIQAKNYFGSGQLGCPASHFHKGFFASEKVNVWEWAGAAHAPYSVKRMPESCKVAWADGYP